MIYLLVLLLGCNLFWIVLFWSSQRIAKQNAKQIATLSQEVTNFVSEKENLVSMCQSQMTATVYLIQVADTWKRKYFTLQDAYLQLAQCHNLKLANQLDN